jgi:hypothetical protein
VLEAGSTATAAGSGIRVVVVVVVAGEFASWGGDARAVAGFGEGVEGRGVLVGEGNGGGVEVIRGEGGVAEVVTAGREMNASGG